MILAFGKYKGNDVSKVYRADKAYLEWLLKKYQDDSNDPQWGAKNAKSAVELQNAMRECANEPPVSMAVQQTFVPTENKTALSDAQVSKERMEISDKIGNHNLSDIYNKVKSIKSLEDKLTICINKLDELYNELAVVKWYVQGKEGELKVVAGIPVLPSKPENIEWTE